MAIRPLKPLLESLSVDRTGPGRPRTRPDKVLGDKAYSSKANRELLRSRAIEAVISEPSDHEANRKRRGQAGGRPPAFNVQTYTKSNTVERGFNVFKQWRGLATRYDNLALTTAAESSCAPSPFGYANKERRPRWPLSMGPTTSTDRERHSRRGPGTLFD